MDLAIANGANAVLGIRRWVSRQGGSGGEDDEGEREDDPGELHFDGV